MHAADFWSSTPRQIIASLQARSVCIARGRDLAIAQAYFTAVLTRWNGKKKAFPKLDDLLSHAAPRRAMSIEEQRRRMDMLVSRKAMN